MTRQTGEGAVVAAVIFAVYASGACPTIYVGDSGELATAVHLLGIPHPSGYPLYVLLGKVWSVLLPVGSVAYRLSLFSAAAAAAACGTLYVTGRRLGLHPVAAATASGLLAFSPSFWGEANVQRVYALNALFVAVATLVAFSWVREPNRRRLVAAGLVCGLGAANHTAMAVYAASLALYLVAAHRHRLTPHDAGAAAAAFAAGLLPYAWLPIRSRQNPALDWGNPETLSALAAVVLRRDFWDRAWIERPADLLVVLADYLWSLGSELAWIGLAIAAVGVAAGVKRGWPVALPLLVMGTNLAAVALHGSRSDLFIWHRYYMPSYVMAAWLAALGAHAIVERLGPRARPALLLLPAALLAIGWRDFDRSRYRVAEDFSRTLLAHVLPGAHLAASDDNILFVLMYLHFVEGVRPDVHLILQGVGDADLPPLRFNPDRDPLFFTNHPNWSLSELDVVPAGLVFRTVRSGSRLPPAPNVPPLLDGEADPRVPKDYLTQNLIGQFHYMRGLTAEMGDWAGADREFSVAMRAAPDNDVLYYNLGLVFARSGLYDRSIAAFERAREINPRTLASRSRPRAADRLAEVKAERDRLAVVERDFPGGPAGARAGGDLARWHLRMAEWLAAQGERIAARGHRLRAASIEGGGDR